MFKIGDKVKIVCKTEVPFGTIGTIVYIDNEIGLPYLVLFKEWNKGHNGGMVAPKYRCKPEYNHSHYWVNKYEIELYMNTPRDKIRHELLKEVI